MIRTGPACERVDEVSDDKTADETDDGSERDSGCRLSQSDASDENDCFKTLTHDRDEWQDEQSPLARDRRAISICRKIWVRVELTASKLKTYVQPC